MRLKVPTGLLDHYSPYLYVERENRGQTTINQWDIQQLNVVCP